MDIETVKIYFVGYVGSKASFTREGGSTTVGRNFLSLKGSILCGCMLLLAFIEKGFPITGLPVDFLQGEPSLQLNGLFTSDGTHRRLERKDYQYIDMVFHLICVHAYKATGYTEDAKTTKANTV